MVFAVVSNGVNEQCIELISANCMKSTIRISLLKGLIFLHEKSTFSLYLMIFFSSYLIFAISP